MRTSGGALQAALHEARRAGRCGGADVRDGARAAEAALRSEDADALKTEERQLSALADGHPVCSAALRRLARELGDVRCRREAAEHVTSAGARATILDGAAPEAARALLAAARESDAPEKLRACAGRLGAETGASGVLRACDATASGELVRARLHDDAGLEELADALPDGTPAERLCRLRVRAAADAARDAGCRETFAAALGDAPRGASQELLEKLLALRARGDAPDEAWRSDPEVFACLQRSDSPAAREVLERAGGAEGAVRAEARGAARRRGAGLREAAHEASRRAQAACAKVLARAPQDAVGELLAARELKGIKAARRRLEAELSELRPEALGGRTALKARDVDACRAAARDFADARAEQACVPQLGEYASASGSESEYLEKVARAARRDPRLRECAELVSPVVAWERWHEGLKRSAALAPADAAVKRAVCQTLTVMQAAPTSPAAPLPLLALCALPVWTHELYERLANAGAGGRARALASPNGAAVLHPKLLRLQVSLKEELVKLLKRPSALPALAAQPCAPTPRELYGNIWLEYGMRAFGDLEADEASEVGRSLTQLQARVLDAGLRAAERAKERSLELLQLELNDRGLGARLYQKAEALVRRPYDPSTTRLRDTVWQQMWESYLAHVDRLLLSVAERIDVRGPHASFVRREILFFLVLFDSYGRGRRTETALPSWAQLLHGFGLWEKPEDPRRLERCASVALKQHQLWTVKRSGADGELFYDTQTRAEQFHRDPSAFLPAPSIYPLVPF